MACQAGLQSSQARSSKPHVTVPLRQLLDLGSLEVATEEALKEYTKVYSKARIPVRSLSARSRAQLGFFPLFRGVSSELPRPRDSDDNRRRTARNYPLQSTVLAAAFRRAKWRFRVSLLKVTAFRNQLIVASKEFTSKAWTVMNQHSLQACLAALYRAVQQGGNQTGSNPLKVASMSPHPGPYLARSS